jgi:hypothetical protein
VCFFAIGNFHYCISHEGPGELLYRNIAEEVEAMGKEYLRVPSVFDGSFHDQPGFGITWLEFNCFFAGKKEQRECEGKTT